MILNITKTLAVIYITIYVAHFTILQYFLPDITNIYYLVIPTGAIFLLKNYNKYRSYVIPVLFASSFSLFFNSYTIPNAEVRWILWINILIVCGPFISNPSIDKFRELLLKYILYVFLFITVGSFFWILLALPSYGVDEDLFLGEGKYFRNGLTNHEMTLAPIGGISGIFFVYKCAFCRQKKSKIILYILLLIISLVVMIMASSRTVIVSFFAVIIFMMLVNRNIFVIFVAKKILNIFILIFFLLFVANTYWLPISNFIDSNSRLSEKGMLNSRQSLIDSRLEDFTNSPIIGAGFCSVSKRIYNRGSLNNMLVKSEQIEFGSLYLQVVSTMGLFGLVSFLLVILNVLRTGFRKLRDKNEQFYLSILIFVLIHSIAEAYVFSAGSIFCIFSWLLISKVSSGEKLNNVGYLKNVKHYRNGIFINHALPE